MELTVLLTSLLALSTSVLAKATRQNAVLLSQVKSLTLRDGQLTSHRRVDPLPQLNCVEGNACNLYKVDVMRCKNSGSEYSAEDVQWTCQASLPPEFKLGSTDLICEGYDDADDPYVLKGSCGVEYRLVLTEAGEEKYGKSAFEHAWRQPSSKTIGNAIAQYLFWTIFIAVIAIFIYRIFVNPGAGQPGNGGRLGWNGGGGGGGDDGGNDDPPPPYSRRPYQPKAPKPSSSYRANQATPGQNSDGMWRPGFWTGAAAGAAGSWAANAWNNRNTARPTRDRVYEYDPPQPGPSTNWFGRTRDPSPPRSSWFGTGAGPSTYNTRSSSSSFGGGRSGFGGGSSSSTPAPSSSRYESTGFGGTRRR